MYKALLALFIFIYSLAGQAKVFNFGADIFSTYLRGTGGVSQLNADAFNKSSGTTTVFTDEATLNYSAEIGLALTLYKVTVRLGLEALQPKTVTGAKGLDGSGTELLSLDSEGLAFLPTISFELLLSQMPDSRFFLGLGLGYGSYTMKNTYTISAAGTVALGVTDFVEEAKSKSVIGGHAYIGYEAVFTDNVTFAIEGGYRIYRFSTFSHTQASSTILGAVNINDKLLKEDGSDRDLDMSGAYLGLSLRFYINID